MVRVAIVAGAACVHAALLCGAVAGVAGWTPTAIAFGITAVIVAVVDAAATVAVVAIRTGKEYEGMCSALDAQATRCGGLRAQVALLALHLAGARERIRELDYELAVALHGRPPAGSANPLRRALPSTVQLGREPGEQR